MEYRYLGRSGLKVPELCFGAGTFGYGTEFFKTWGETTQDQADEIVRICMDAGLNFFDTADVYSDGTSEEVLGKSLKQFARGEVLVSTKATFRQGRHTGPNQVGSSRYHLIEAVHSSLQRLGTEETLSALNHLVLAGKVRYIACSNFSGWHLMKSLSVSERYGWERYVGHQAYYSLVDRDYEWELMPLALDQGVGALVWSPLGWGRLTGKIRRGQPPAKGSRLGEGGDKGGPTVPEEHLYKVVDAIDEIAKETGKTVPQIALNWLLQRPTVSTLIVGARNAEQLRSNLGAVGWALTPEQVAKLDAASEKPLAYPYWHQRGFEERNPKPV